MDDSDYPALYISSNSASINAQKHYLNCIKAYSTLIILAAGFGIYGINTDWSAILAAILFFLTIILVIFMETQKFENTWYKTRAIAESIKTSTWKFMMRAEPFENENKIEQAKNKFTTLLRQIINEHRDIGSLIGGTHASNNQITEFMCNIRLSNLEDRIKFYTNNRIDEQREWYANKSERNSSSGTRYTILLILALIFAIITVLFRIKYPEFKYWPTELFAVAASSLLAWIQVKRFNELAAAYGLTAHEIGLSKAEIHKAIDEKSFSDFVNDTENAFSREHTQWAARKET